MAELSVYDNDPTLYLFTSLTAGSSHIVTATSRIETILKANKISFKGVDTATDDLARKLYGRRASGRKLPLLVKEGYVIADLEQIEEWNEYDELKEALGAPSAPAPVPPKHGSNPATISPPKAADTKENTPSATSEQNLAIRQLGAEAAKVAAAKKPTPANIATTNPLLSEKVNSPAVSTPTKTDASGILSPRSIPLPTTPNPATTSKASDEPSSTTSGIPKIESKPVHSPPSMHIDASNPSDAAAPIDSTTAKSPTSSSSMKSPSLPTSPGKSRSGVASPVTEFHGHKVGTPTKEEIKKVEDEQAIKEASISEEEDSEEEDNEEEDSEEEDSEEDSEEEKEKDKPATEKTQDQDPKAADKAGESVKD